MADELEILTTNAAADGWIDNIPGAVSTGYQAQNTNISARSLGQDLTYLRVSDDLIGVTLEISGPVDDGGVPFKLAAQTTLYPTSNGTWYVAITAGSGALNRSVELIQGTPIYDSTEGVLKVGVYRILNWTITMQPQLYITVSPIAQTGALGGAFPLQSPDGYIRYRDYPYLWWVNYYGSFSSPGGVPRGLTYAEGNLISCDSAAGIIYIHNGVSSSILSNFSAPASSPFDLAFDGTNLISCDSATDRVYIHDGISASVLSSFAGPSTNLYGITYDGTNLISFDAGTNLYYVHSGISSTILSSFSITEPTTAGHGITYDGTNLITTRAGSAGAIGVIIVSNGVGPKIKTKLDAPSTNLNGVAYDGVNLISSDIDDDEIFLHGFDFS